MIKMMLKKELCFVLTITVLFSLCLNGCNTSTDQPMPGEVALNAQEITVKDTVVIRFENGFPTDSI